MIYCCHGREIIIITTTPSKKPFPRFKTNESNLSRIRKKAVENMRAEIYMSLYLEKSTDDTQSM